MKHTSVIMDSPCEFINVTPLNPLISKCQIKVCYVGDTPNRNRSVITKDVAKQMANSLPGSPIVGFYNEYNGDFEEHNRVIDISNGKFEIKDTTRPYGFVDLNAKVWFQKFLDDGLIEHEYLMTEGYLWTGQYDEAQRIIDEGNNQSMELDEKTLNAAWTKDGNGKPQFFIINEAVISKLCILGEDVEPCFEGSNITNVQFSFEDGFKEQLFSMMNQLKEILNEGGAPMFTKYAVEIGDALWSAIYTYLEDKYADPDCTDYRRSLYGVEGIYEEGTQKFAILRDRKGNKLYRMNFTYTEAGFVASETLTEVTKTYTPVGETQFKLEDIEAFETERYKKKEEPKDKGKEDKTDPKKTEDSTEDKKDPKPEDKPEDDEEKKKKKYNLDEIEEYTELSTKYSELETKYSELESKFNLLTTENSDLKAQVEPLTQFKKETERKDKEAMIADFYMLSDEDKKDVVENIDTYSLSDIEAKLSIICVRNKVDFNLENENKDKDNSQPPITYNLNGNEGSDSIPAWVKAVQSVAKTMNN